MNTVIEFAFHIFVFLNGETIAGHQNIKDKGSVVHINYNKFKFFTFIVVVRGSFSKSLFDYSIHFAYFSQIYIYTRFQTITRPP
jgi:hypothetical protein